MATLGFSWGPDVQTLTVTDSTDPARVLDCHCPERAGSSTLRQMTPEKFHSWSGDTVCAGYRTTGERNQDRTERMRPTHYNNTTFTKMRT